MNEVRESEERERENVELNKGRKREKIGRESNL